MNERPRPGSDQDPEQERRAERAHNPARLPVEPDDLPRPQGPGGEQHQSNRWPVWCTNTSCSVGRLKRTDRTSPGNASITWPMNSCARSRSMRTTPSTTAAGSANRSRRPAASCVRPIGVDGDDVAAERGREIARATREHHAPTVEDGHAVAGLGFVHQVGRQHDGGALRLAQPAQIAPEIRAHAGIEAGRGLVEQQEPRSGQQRLRDFGAAGEPARQRRARGPRRAPRAARGRVPRRSASRSGRPRNPYRCP